MAKKEVLILGEDYKAPSSLSQERILELAEIETNEEIVNNQKHIIINIRKGILWNEASHGTKGKIVERFKWPLSTVKHYANMLKEMTPRSLLAMGPEKAKTLIYSGLSKEDKKKFISIAKSEEISSSELHAKISLHKRESDPPSKKTTRPEPEFDSTQAEKQERVRRMVEDAERMARNMMSQNMAKINAYSSLGLQGCTGITKESLEVLYKHYSKQHHPDTGGSEEKMKELNAAKDELMKVVIL